MPCQRVIDWSWQLLNRGGVQVKCPNRLFCHIIMEISLSGYDDNLPHVEVFGRRCRHIRHPPELTAGIWKGDALHSAKNKHRNE